jgi:sulfofructose kinase
MSARFDVVGVGLAVYDISMQVDSYPESDTKVDAQDYWHGGGGPVPNTLVALAKWGIRTAYVGRAGDDLWGRALKDAFVSFGVDVTYFDLDPSQVTPVASILVDSRTGDRTAVLARRFYSQPTTLPASIIENAAIVHMDARDPKLCLEVATRAHKSGVEVSLDVGSPRLDAVPVLAATDHLVVALRFAEAATEHTSPPKMLESLGRLTRGPVVITQGTSGSMGISTVDPIVQCGIFSVSTIDTTGAGDLYHAGYLYGVLQGWSLKRRMTFGAAAAALATTGLGARGCIPELAQVVHISRQTMVSV